MSDSARVDAHEEATLEAWHSDEERILLFNTLRKQIGQVHHDLSNPLSIITGNAQFFLEVAKVMGLEEDLMQPVRDIEAAAERMASLLSQLGQLKQAIPSQAATER